MRELKTIKITGDMISGDIFEVIDNDENYKLRFRIDEMTGGTVTGERATKKVRIRYNLDELIEFRDDLDQIIERMKHEL